MGSSRDALFDLAVNRAAAVAGRLAPADDAALRRALEVWYLKTRFASRLPFDGVLAAVRRRPPGAVRWQGGSGGGWSSEPPSEP